MNTIKYTNPLRQEDIKLFFSIVSSKDYYNVFIDKFNPYIYIIIYIYYILYIIFRNFPLSFQTLITYLTQDESSIKVLDEIHDRICNYFFEKKVLNSILERRFIVDDRVRYQNEHDGKLPPESCCSKIVRRINGLSSPYVFDYEVEVGKENDYIRDVIEYYEIIFCPEGFLNQNRYVNKSIKKVMRNGGTTSMTIERRSNRRISQSKEQDAQSRRTARSRTSFLADDLMRSSKRLDLRQSISVFDPKNNSNCHIPNNNNSNNNINNNSNKTNLNLMLMLNRSSNGLNPSNNISPFSTFSGGTVRFSVKLEEAID